jgi:hypothetical protein
MSPAKANPLKPTHTVKVCGLLLSVLRIAEALFSDPIGERAIVTATVMRQNFFGAGNSLKKGNFH